MKFVIAAILLIGTTAFADSSKSAITTRVGCNFADLGRHVNLLRAEYDIKEDETIDVISYNGHLYQVRVRHYTFRKQLMTQYVLIVKDATTKAPIGVATADFHKDEPMVNYQDGPNNIFICYPIK